MFNNKEINLCKAAIQAEVDDLYNELERRFGAGFADQIIKKYTDFAPRIQYELG